VLWWNLEWRISQLHVIPEYVNEPLWRRWIPRYLVEILWSDMKRRTIRISDGNRTYRPVTRDILQSSIFVFMLSNIFYDNILNMDISKEVQLISLANDLDLLSVAQQSDTLARMVDSMMDAIDAWKGNYRLHLLNGTRWRPLCWLKSGILKSDVVFWDHAVLYSHLTFSEHFRTVLSKMYQVAHSLVWFISILDPSGSKDPKLNPWSMTQSHCLLSYKKLYLYLYIINTI